MFQQLIKSSSLVESPQIIYLFIYLLTLRQHVYPSLLESPQIIYLFVCLFIYLF